MTRRGTVGRLLLQSLFPQEMADQVAASKFDKKGLSSLLETVAKEHPAKYRDITFKLNQIGLLAAYRTGGNSFGLEHVRQSKAAKARRLVINAKLKEILDDDNLTDDQRDKLITLAAGDILTKERDEIYDESVAEKSPLAMQLIGAGRGNKMNLASLRGSDGFYQDHRNRMIPIPVLKSYAQGLSPVELWCLAGDTLVRMADGSKVRMMDIKPGDWVLGATKYGTTLPVRVVNTFFNGVQPCFQYKFRVGQMTRMIGVVATSAHKVLATPGIRGHRHEDPSLVPLGRFIDDEWRAMPAGELIQDSGIVEKRAGLLGLLLGDGCLRKKGSITYACADSTLIEDGQVISAEADCTLSKNGHIAYIVKHDESVRGRLHPLKPWLRELGLLGKKSPQKFIPPQVWTWDNESVAALIGGLYATDGSVDVVRRGVPMLKFHSTAKKLLIGVAELLAVRFGIYVGAIERREPGDRKIQNPDGSVRILHNKYPLYTIRIGSIRQIREFARLIPVPGCKGKLLTEALAAFKSVRETRFSFYKDSRHTVGHLPTYDLEVDHPDHLFVLANGLIVSNSATYGARQGVYAVKVGTARAGYLGKLLAQVAHRLIVTAEDADDPKTLVGYPVDADDPDNEGALLAAPIAGYARNTVLTPKILSDIRRQGNDQILVRSPVVSGSPEGGVYARDVGIREFGKLPAIGEFAGITAAQALSEPVSQANLGAKHSGGVAGESKAFSTFDRIEAMIQVPKSFPGGAAHATLDGHVSRVEEAPAGGWHVVIDGESHYVHPGYDLKVKVGDTVEAGDVISNGTPNPLMITKYKGVGEGRRYFVDTIRQVLSEAGITGHRRNLELIARGLINHVRLTDEVGDYLPDDVVPYSAIEHRYEPREGFMHSTARSAVGKYLERPYLHYSIGTRVKPSMIPQMERYGIQEVDVHDDPPPFQPEMIRGPANLQYDPDWMTQMFGAGLQKSLLESTHRGATSDESGTSFVPGRAKAINFGQVGSIKSPDRQLGY